jgi:DUF3068 family protein
MATPRRSRVPLMLGITLIVAAAVLRVWGVPALSKLPADTDQTAEYAGTMQSADPATFQLGKAAPITAERRVRVTKTYRDAAVIESDLTLHTPAGDSNDVHSYAISRKDFDQVEAPAGASVEDQKGGMTISRPADPTKGDFTVYDPVTQTAQPVRYAATRTLDGREVYDFAGETTAQVRSPKLLAQLQAGVAALARAGDGTTLPKPLLQRLGATLDPDQAAAFDKLFVTLPDEVPLVFTSTNQVRLAIDTKFGAPVATAQTQTVTVNIDTGAKPVPLVALSRLHVDETPASVKNTAAFLSKAGTMLALASLWLPLGLVIVGLALVVAGVRRRLRPVTPASSEELVGARG